MIFISPVNHNSSMWGIIFWAVLKWSSTPIGSNNFWKPGSLVTGVTLTSVIGTGWPGTVRLVVVMYM